MAFFAKFHLKLKKAAKHREIPSTIGFLKKFGKYERERERKREREREREREL